jgi:hypothetical protein
MADFTFHMKAVDIDETAFKELQDLEARKAKIIESLRRDMLKKDIFKAAMLLVGTNDYGGKRSTIPAWTGHGFNVAIIMDEVKAHQPYTAPVHIDPKTMNALIHGNLLTNTEKRALIASFLPSGVLEVSK